MPAQAAGPTTTGSYVIQVTTPLKLRPTDVDSFQFVRTSPAEAQCRFSAFVISPTRANAAVLVTAVAQAKAAKQRISVAFTRAPDGVCLLDAVSTSTAPGTVSLKDESGAPVDPWGGYHDKYATSYKSAIRDFGQGKVDESVDPITGVLSIRHADLVLPGVGGMDIRVVRRYQSPDPKTVGLAMISSLNPQFYGLGWSMYVNFGGARGLPVECPRRGPLNDGGIYDWMRIEHLPTWIDGEGHIEPMVYDGGATWVGASGVRVSCGIDAALQRTATLLDGTKIALSTYGQPKRIEDRWGNWIQIDYVEEYAQLLLTETWVGLVASTVFPMRTVTSSDGRVVEFVYGSNAPGWVAPTLPSIVDFSLQKIRYGGNEIQYSYDRVEMRVDTFSGTGQVGKYFLNEVKYPDGLGFKYGTNLGFPLPSGPAFCGLAAGVGSMSKITYPHGGFADYTWIPSARTDAPYACWIVPSPSFVSPMSKLRRKSTSDGGVWQYGYSDLPFNLRASPVDDAPADPPNPTGIEWGRVIGPDRTVVSYSYDRFGITVLPSESGNVNQAVPVRLLGRLIRRDTVAPGSRVQREEFTYVPAYGSAPGLLHADPMINTPGQVANTPNALGDSGYLMWQKDTTVMRGSASYSTVRNFDSACAKANSVIETGQRSRKRDTVFDASAYCHTINEKTYEGVSLKSDVVRTLTADKKNVAREDHYGPTRVTPLTKKYTYNGNGEVATATDPRNYVTYFNLYKRGTPQQELHPVSALDGNTDPFKISISRVVDDLGRITSETDGEGRTTYFAYNGVHKPTLITLPRTSGYNELKFAYGTTQDTITRGSGATIGRSETVSYDGFGRVKTYDDAGIATSYSYDAAGRRTFVSFPGRNAGQSVVFDALNRPTQLTEPDPSGAAASVSTNVTYDDGLAKVTVTNARGAANVFTMEAFGDPSHAWVKTRDLPVVGLMTMDRNVFGQITKVTHNATVREMVYDESKGYFLKQEKHPELGSVFYDRDGNGNATSRYVVSPSAVTSPTTSYTYDGQNRLQLTTPATGVGEVAAPSVTNVWYRTGQLKSTTAGGVQREYAYDENNNLLNEKVTIDGNPRILAYGYDSLDSLNQVTYPSPSNRVINFAPDVHGRPTQVASNTLAVVTSVIYWPSGMPREITFANGVKQNFDEQTARPLASALRLATGASANLLNLAFGYDTVGNMLATTETATSFGYARTSTFDLFDRLSTSVGSTGSEAFTYAGIADINTKSGASFGYANGRLVSVSAPTARTYGYDVYGNAASDGRFGFGYDALSTLRQVKNSSGTVVSDYVYDGHQHLAKKSASGATTQYLYGKNGRLFGEYFGATSKEYFYLGNKLVGQVVK